MKKLNYRIIATGNVKLRLSDKPTVKIPGKKGRIIDKLWKDILQKRGGLFNGQLLEFASVNKNGDNIHLSGNFIEYKQFIADKKQPELKLNIKPVGVSGIIIAKEDGIDYAVFARRTKEVTDYPNFLELVPSGSIDREFLLKNGDIDYRSKILSEFSEETGLPKNYVKQISGFALVLDASKNIYDICCTILVKKDRATITKYFHKSKEYKNFQFVPLKDLYTFIEETDSIVPTSIALIKAYTQFTEKKSR